MGPSLARMARRALDDAGGAASGRTVYAVSRFGGEAGAATERLLPSRRGARARRPHRAPQVDALPDAANVVHAGQSSARARAAPPGP